MDWNLDSDMPLFTPVPRCVDGYQRPVREAWQNAGDGDGDGAGEGGNLPWTGISFSGKEILHEASCNIDQDKPQWIVGHLAQMKVFFIKP